MASRLHLLPSSYSTQSHLWGQAPALDQHHLSALIPPQTCLRRGVITTTLVQHRLPTPVRPQACLRQCSTMPTLGNPDVGPASQQLLP